MQNDDNAGASSPTENASVPGTKTHGVQRGKATEADVRSAFIVFNAEFKPSAERVSKRVGADLGKLIGLLVRSPRFHEAIVGPLSAGGSVAHARHSVFAPEGIVDWLKTMFPKGTFADRLDPRPDWIGLLVELLQDETFTSEFGIIPPETVRAASAIRRVVVGSLERVSGPLVVGWAADRNNPGSHVVVDLQVNGIPVGSAAANKPRADHPDETGRATERGFEFLLPPHLDWVGARASLTMTDAVTGSPIGEPLPLSREAKPARSDFDRIKRTLASLETTIAELRRELPLALRAAGIPLSHYADGSDAWLALPPEDRAGLAREAESLPVRPRFSVIVTTRDNDAARLERTLTSVKDQIYPEWELLVSDCSVSQPDVTRRLVQRTLPSHAAVRFLGSPLPLPASSAASSALVAATGDFVCFLRAEDELAPDALLEFAKSLQDDAYDIVYTDEDRFSLVHGERYHHSPVFKPALDRDLILSQDYIGRSVVVRRSFVGRVGVFHDDLDGAHEHDFLLRVLELTKDARVLHVPRILYHGHSAGAPTKPSAADDQRILKLVNEHFRRIGSTAEAVLDSDAGRRDRKTLVRVVWPLPARPPSVSIIIPTRDRNDLTGPCVSSILATQSAYAEPPEIIVVDNGSVDPQTRSYLSAMAGLGSVRIIEHRGSFNWSLLNNMAAEQASGEVLIFLNNDTVVRSVDWIKELVSHASRPGIGAVSGKLLYEDGTIQHTGVLLGVGAVAAHDGVGQHGAEGGYLDRNYFTRRVSCVTGACLATPAAVLRELGGFDEVRFKHALNDVDYCERVRQAGYGIVYTPFAVLHHYERTSRGQTPDGDALVTKLAERQAYIDRWGSAALVDPFYNANFDRRSAPFSMIRPV